MDVRKLGEKGESNRPDRSNASWQRDSSKQAEHAPQQVPPKPAEKVTTLATQRGTRRRSRSRKNDWDKSSKQVQTKTPTWLIALLFIFLVGCLGALVLTSLKMGKSLSTDRTSSTLEITIDQEIEGMNFGPVSDVLPHEVAMSFAMTADPQERLQHCRNPKQVAALIPEFSQQALSEIGVSGSPMGESNTHGLEVQRFKVVLEGGDTRMIFVVRTDEGPKVDWEAYAMHGQGLKRWIHEAQNSPQSTRKEETAEVRVFAIRDRYYNYRFSDESLWHAYKIGNTDLGTAVTAYAKAGSTTAKILSQEVVTEKRLTLQLRSRTEDARNGQYEIERILAIDWVEPEGDFEENWQRKNQR